jgi:hypothetical protein
MCEFESFGTEKLSPILTNNGQFLSPKDSFGITPRRDMAERFLQEASNLLQNETKRTSLPTCQATCLMHAAIAIKNEASDTLWHMN